MWDFLLGGTGGWLRVELGMYCTIHNLYIQLIFIRAFCLFSLSKIGTLRYNYYLTPFNPSN